MSITKEQFAARLNGREMGQELTKAEESEAEESDLVVVFGYSDDCTEFRGRIHDEVGLGELIITTMGVIDKYHKCNCDYCGHPVLTNKGKKLESIFGNNGWTFETEIPHATFDIMEDGELFCKGIVFNIADVVL